MQDLGDGSGALYCSSKTKKKLIKVEPRHHYLSCFSPFLNSIQKEVRPGQASALSNHIPRTSHVRSSLQATPHSSKLRNFKSLKRPIGATILTDKLGIDLIQVARKKIEINRTRHLAKLVKGKADNHTEYEE